jgi:hypothetical protein
VTLEELIIKIRADAHGVTSTLDKTKKDIQGVEGQTKSTRGVMGRLFEGVGPGAGVAAAGVAAGAAIVAKSIDTYRQYGKEVKSMMRITGASAEEASMLVGQMKLIGGEDLNTADALGRWAVNLNAARDSASSQGKLMKSLGVELKNTDGSWRDSAEVLMDFRDKMAAMNDVTARNADLQVMLGRGYRQILPYFTKSKDEIDEYSKALKDMGLVMTQEDMDTWGKFMGDEKMLGMLFTAMQIKIARLVIPTLNELMPLINTMVGWLTKIPDPVLKAAAGFGMLWAAMKIGGAGVQMYRNLKGMIDVTRVLGGNVRNLSGAFGAVTRNMGGVITKIPALIAAYGPLLIALAAVAVAVYAIVKAYQAWKTAADQAAAAASGSAATDQKAQAKIDAWKQAHPGQALPKGYQRLQDYINQNPADYQAPKGVAGWANAAARDDWKYWFGGGFANTLGFARGGVVSGPKSGYPVTLHGTERVTRLPDKGGSGRPLHVEVKASFLSMPSRGQVREVARMVSDEVMRNTLMTEAGSG